MQQPQSTFRKGKFPLHEICEITTGYTWPSSRFSESGNIQVIRISDLEQTNMQKLKWWKGAYDTKYVVQKGDILLGVSGKIKLVKWEGPKALLNQRIVKLNPVDGINREWFFYKMKAVLPMLEQIGRHASINNIALQDLNSFTLEVPSDEYQLYVSTLFSKLDLLLQKSFELKQTLAFQNDLLFTTCFGYVHNGDTALRELMRVDAKGSSDSCNYEQRMVGLAQIERSTGLITDEEADYSSVGKYNFTSDHILYGKLRPNFNKVATPDFDGKCTTEILPILPHSADLKYFLANVLRSPAFVDYAVRHAAGAGLPRINKHILLDYKIQRPSASKLKAYNKQAYAAHRQLHLLQQEINALQKLYRQAMQKYLI